MKLLATFENQKVGELIYEPSESTYSFEYDLQWKEQGRFLLSPHIPFQNSTSVAISNFLENVLPEGRGLKDLSQLLKVTQSNIYALVAAIGQEISGGIRFQQDGALNPTRFVEVSEQTLKSRVAERQSQSIAIWNGKPRLSVAGVQEKLPIVRKDNAFGFGSGDIASTHILKFGNAQTEHLVLNEYFCMKLAKACGLQVASVEVLGLGERVLQVQRFDRNWNEKFQAVRRTHLIDGCQALNIAPAHKYERFLGDEDSVKDLLGPASFKNIYDFCHQLKVPAKERLQLLDWVIFNLLIGNSDNHMKNLSFFITDAGMELAPFYDLVSVTIYEKLDHSLAFCIGETFNPEKVNERELLLMAHELEISESFLKRQFKKMQSAVSNHFEKIDLVDLSLKRDEKDFIKNLQQKVASNLERF